MITGTAAARKRRLERTDEWHFNSAGGPFKRRDAAHMLKQIQVEMKARIALGVGTFVVTLSSRPEPAR